MRLWPRRGRAGEASGDAASRTDEPVERDETDAGDRAARDGSASNAHPSADAEPEADTDPDAEETQPLFVPGDQTVLGQLAVDDAHDSPDYDDAHARGAGRDDQGNEDDLDHRDGDDSHHDDHDDRDGDRVEAPGTDREGADEDQGVEDTEPVLVGPVRRSVLTRTGDPEGWLARDGETASGDDADVAAVGADRDPSGPGGANRSADREPAPARRRRGAADGDGAAQPEVTDEHTLRTARRRFRRRMWRRRWLAWRRLVVGVAAVAILVGAGWLVFFSPVLAVSGVQVAGTRGLASAQVRKVAAVPLGQPLATVGLDAISARVEALPSVRAVDVSRSWPDRVRIDVTERRPVAVVQSSGSAGGLRAVDDQGVLFGRYASRPSTLPVIRTGADTHADALAEAARVAGSLPASLTRRVAFVRVRTVDRISLELRNGTMVRWGSAEASNQKAEVLAALLKHRASFYDVSVASQPIIRR